MLNYFITILCTFSMALLAKNSKNFENPLLTKSKIESKVGPVKDPEPDTDSAMIKAIYHRSKLMPKEHIHGPNCEHNLYKID